MVQLGFHFQLPAFLSHILDLPGLSRWSLVLTIKVCLGRFATNYLQSLFLNHLILSYYFTEIHSCGAGWVYDTNYRADVVSPSSLSASLQVSQDSLLSPPLPPPTFPHTALYKTEGMQETAGKL